MATDRVIDAAEQGPNPTRPFILAFEADTYIAVRQSVLHHRVVRPRLPARVFVFERFRGIS